MHTDNVKLYGPYQKTTTGGLVDWDKIPDFIQY